MRKLTDGEVISLTGLLTMEKDALTVSRALSALVADADLKEQVESSILATEGRIKGLQQFINENQVTGIEEV